MINYAQYTTIGSQTGKISSPNGANLNDNEIKLKYCLYARKSTESEERQVLSIDSQIKEMLDLAVKENIDVIEIKRESHSAKETGQRAIFNE